MNLAITLSTCSTNTLELAVSSVRFQAGTIYELDRLLGHIVDDNKVHFSNIQALLANRGRHQDIELALLELLDCLSPDQRDLGGQDFTHLLLLFLIETLVDLLLPLRLPYKFGRAQ